MRKLFLATLLFIFSINCFAIPKTYYSLLESIGPEKRVLSALGVMPGTATNVKFGANFDINADGNEHTLWVCGDGAYHGFTLTTAKTLTVVSDDATDTIAGIGAQKVKIFGLDLNLLEIDEELEMNGTTPVSTTKQYMRINRMYVSQGGSSGNAQGDIYLKDGTDPMACVISSYNQTLQSIVTIPADKYGVIPGFTTTVYKKSGAAVAIKEVEFIYKAREPGGVFRTQIIYGQRSDFSQVLGHFTLPFVFPPKTDLVVNTKTNTADSAAAIYYEIWLFDREWIENAKKDMGITP